MTEFDLEACVNFNEDMSISFKDNLPHADQKGKYQYITFRLADSLPSSKCQELKTITDEFLAQNPRPWNRETIIQYWQRIGPMESRLLDKGFGACLLRKPEIRNIVASAINHFDGKRYDTVAYVIMPNHIHLLIKCRASHSISQIVYSIKRFTASQVNKLLNRTGPLWMKRYFDRLPRTEADFTHYIKYIKANPYFLPPEDYTLYIAGETN